MSDLSKLIVADLLGIVRTSEADGGDMSQAEAEAVIAEIVGRFSAQESGRETERTMLRNATARISELEQELQEARERVEWLDNACRAYDSKIEAAEKERDEAREAAVRTNGGLLARVVVLEEALRPFLAYPRVLNIGASVEMEVRVPIKHFEIAREALVALSSPVAEEEET